MNDKRDHSITFKCLKDSQEGSRREMKREEGGVAKQKPPELRCALGVFIYKNRRRPTLPHSFPCSTIGAEELNFRVRDENGWNLFAMTTDKGGEW